MNFMVTSKAANLTLYVLCKLNIENKWLSRRLENSDIGVLSSHLSIFYNLWPII